jgi:transcriptional regulator with XRE-family HTH domain
VIDYIRNQIKKRRVEKGLTQSDVALDLGITPGAYSKIESGPTEISVKKLGAIAKILEVEMSYFFRGQVPVSNLEDNNKSYGFATKTDIEELTRLINKMKQEIASLKASLQPPAARKKKKV